MVTKKELYKQAKAIKSKNCPAISRYSKRQLNLFIIVKGKKAKPDKNLKIMPVKAPPKAPPKAQKKNLNPPVVIKQPKQSKQSNDKPTKPAKPKQSKQDAKYRAKGEMTAKEEKKFLDNLKIPKKKDTFDYSSLLPDESAKPKKQSKDKPTKAKKKEKPLSYDKWNDVFRGGTGNKKGYDRYLSRF